ncbi:MAG: YitT family protein [Deferrisomatales bacterium]|nr:YitT family protein [Deferrisomatales bacterium]
METPPAADPKQTSEPGLPAVLGNLGLILTGSALCAVAINGILIPHRFLSGGFTGLALEIYYLWPVVPVSALYAVLNVPLFAMGWFHVGRRFFLYSLAGVAVFSGALQVVRLPVPVHDPILAALLAGIITGTGSGIILRSFGSAGGSDILSIILLRRFSVRIGTTVLAFNGLVLATAAVLFDLEMALYTLIYIFVTARMVDVVVTGLSQRKAVTIISRRWEEIRKYVVDEIQRGVTVLRAEGGYRREEERVLYTVITFRELARLKREIRRIDPTAFVVVNETLEVMGHRIGNQPHW